MLALAGSSSAASPLPPSQAPLMHAVLSLLPAGAPVSRMQLRSLMGVYAPDLCGCTFKEVGGLSLIHI